MFLLWYAILFTVVSLSMFPPVLLQGPFLETPAVYVVVFAWIFLDDDWQALWHLALWISHFDGIAPLACGQDAQHGENMLFINYNITERNNQL